MSEFIFFLTRGFLRKTLCFALLFIALVPSTVSALSQDQFNVYSSQVYFFDTDGNISGCSSDDTVLSNSLPSTIPQNYADLFNKAGAAYKVNPQFLAAIYLSENGNVWKPFNTQWASSPVGASGPFQFMPGTWDSYKVDGDNDGKTDINNIFDAAFAAANMMDQNHISISTPLGSITAPFKPGTFLYFTASYNWGSGNVQMNTNPTSPITVAPTETENYLKNVYVLITSGFTKSGNPNYGDPQSSGSSTSTSNQISGCSGGIVSGNIAQTAIGLAWPQPPDAASPPRDPLKPTPEYAAAVQKYFPGAPYDGADCGAFVGIVMHASNADKDYPSSGTDAQEAYIEGHPEKYTIIRNATSTADLRPGDILIVNAGTGAGAEGHTMIYVGKQDGGYNEASASMATRMPNLDFSPTNLQDSAGRGHYIVARLK